MNILSQIKFLKTVKNVQTLLINLSEELDTEAPHLILEQA